MSDIATYNAKRNFGRTAEPPGKVAAKRSRDLQFVIQKHDASRLHYDFRLEIGGVLVSWAIPKGPSLDPGEKRLAVRTEDHPMAYGGFEGTIPAGEYGGGTVMLWDRGAWIPEGKETAQTQLRKGSLKFALEGDRLHGSFALVRMKPRKGEKAENWLLIKHGDQAATRGSGDAVVRKNTSSVASKRSMDEIAAGTKVWHSNRKSGKDKPVKSAAIPALAKPKRKSKPVALAPAKLKGSRKAALARKFMPQLATLSETAPEETGWLSEIKFDGYRMLARVAEGAATIYSRNGLDWTDKLPHLAASLAKLPVKQAWLDGEVVSLDDAGHSSFSMMKNALSDKKTGGLFYYLFDLMYLDGYDLGGCAQIDRKTLLAQLLAEPPPFIKYSEHYEGVPERVREQACAMRLEGVICKRADAPYRQNRNRNWLKLKCVQREEFVVVGYTDPKGSRTGFGALLMGYYDAKGALHYAGGVGTGFNQATLTELHGKLQAIERKIGPRIVVHGEEGPPRGIHWVKPELIAEIQFLDWTGDGVLRHAIFLGLREDKEPMDVVREPPHAAKAGRTIAASAVVTARAPRSKAKAKKPAGETQKKIPAIIDNREKGDGEVSLTHPDRVLWPDVGVTKADLAEYWETMADLALPHIVGRALALVRCPDGIDGEQFFQKKASPGFPRQILDLKVAGETVLAIEDGEGLRALSQMSAIEIHPWGSTLDDIERPDRLIFDFDPDPTVGFDRVVEAALALHEALDGVGLKSFAKTTGGKGLHVVVPIQPELEWDDAKAFCRDVAQWMVRADPTRFTAQMAKKARKGRIFVDYLRNGRGATAIAPFSPRARAGATFAMPLAWKEVKPSLDPKRYTLSDAKSLHGPAMAAWKGFFDVEQSLGAKARRFFSGN